MRSEDTVIGIMDSSLSRQPFTVDCGYTEDSLDNMTSAASLDNVYLCPF